MSKPEKLPAHAIIIAGGRGTRFWPRSRTRTPKQLLNIVGAKTMLVQTVERLRPAFPASRVWVVTNTEQAAAVRKQLPGIAASRVLAEPVGRNTAAAIGLAAVHLAQQSNDALMTVLPADHYIAQPEHYRKIVAAALQVASTPGQLVVLGIPPAHPETGFGYIERAREAEASGGFPVFAVERFTEKPALAVAQEYVASGRYYWNAGMFFWRVSTFIERLKKYLPATHGALMRLGDAIGTRRYAATLKRIYPKLENISVDYAIMERATQPGEPPSVFVLPAEVGWSDIGSWAAVHELQAKTPSENVSAGPHFVLDATGNMFWSPRKFVAAIGVKDLIVVETPDALLICPRDRAQDVGKIVKWIEQNKKNWLL
ncbi:MAG: mannose-1-phosphate guanylyltransferase [Acidobacteria bacterium]|nr:mannose-1-phosphate guanylyltransferase [Acidobacteriota bacterium]MBI3663994.1 mannose-1-phosphate guanylyltransferase [Acidobacteriota bacterium]